MSKYERWYRQIIDRARDRTLEEGEVHHILPRSLGGDDDSRNLVKLTYREHFLCHWLLTKFTAGDDRRKMLYGLHCMRIVGGDVERIVSAWQYELGKQALREVSKDRKISEITRHRLSESHLGKKQSVETRQKRRKKMMGRTFSAESIQKMRVSASQRHPEAVRKQSEARKGQKRSPETRERMRLAHLGKGWSDKRRAAYEAKHGS